jgi:hypothetical protein
MPRLNKVKAKAKKPTRRTTKAAAKPAKKATRKLAKTKTAPARLRRPGPPPEPSGPYLGQIRLLPYSFAPQGWASCSGQLLPISQNVALFELISKTYGGNGVSNFALPNLPRRGPSGPYYYIAIEGVLPPH